MKKKPLDLKKELSKLPKPDLIDLLCGLAMASYLSSYRRADVVKDALTDHALKQSEKNKANWSLWEEYERLQALDVTEVETQLINFYNLADSERERKERATFAAVRQRFGAK